MIPGVPGGYLYAPRGPQSPQDPGGNFEAIGGVNSLFHIGIANKISSLEKSRNREKKRDPPYLLETFWAPPDTKEKQIIYQFFTLEVAVASVWAILLTFWPFFENRLKHKN